MLTNELPDYTFICPACREFDLALVESGLKRYTQIHIDPRGYIEWGEPEYDPNEDATESWFECMRCGYTPLVNGETIPEDDFDSLLQWLQDNNGSRCAD
jgi:hypothetical protein